MNKKKLLLFILCSICSLQAKLVFADSDYDGSNDRVVFSDSSSEPEPLRQLSNINKPASNKKPAYSAESSTEPEPLKQISNINNPVKNQKNVYQGNYSSTNDPVPLKGISGLHAEMTPLTFVPYIEIKALYGSSALGEGEALIPFSGSSDSLFFGAIQGDVIRYEEDDKAWFAGLGLGYRSVYDENILGTYLFGNFNYASQFGVHHNFYTVNPGLEYFGNVWEFHLNGYVPIGHSEWDDITTITGFASEVIGQYDTGTVFFQGHSKYDDWVQVTKNTQTDTFFGTRTSTGLGGDFEAGRIIGTDRLKAYVGGYYFATTADKNIGGGSLRVTYQLNDYFGLEVKDTYDNYRHNILMGGVKFSIGGFSHDEKKRYGIAGRLMDPIANNLAVVAYDEKHVPLTTKSTTTITTLQQHVLVGNNFFFFKPSPTPISIVQGDGTYENPYIDFNTLNFQQVQTSPYAVAGANLYFDTGSYSLDNITNHKVLLPQNFNMYGRINNYTMPGVDASRATFTGRIDLPNGGNILDSIILQNNAVSGIGQQTMAMSITGSNVLLSNMLIGANDMQSGYVTGIDIQGGSVSVDGLSLYAYNYRKYNETNVQNVVATGININSGTLNIIGKRKNIISSTAYNDFVGKSKIASFGIVAMSYGINAVNNSAININGGVNNEIISLAQVSALITGKQISPGVKEIIYPDAKVYGIYADHSNVYINSPSNTIKGIGKITVDRQAGYVDDNNIESLMQNLDIHDGVYGIDANYSNIFINSSGNSILAEDTELIGLSNSLGYSRIINNKSFGVLLSNSLFEMNGDANMIKSIGDIESKAAANNGSTCSNNRIAGIYSETSAVNIKSNKNQIIGDFVKELSFAPAQTTGGSANQAIGILAINTKVYLSGHDNEIYGLHPVQASGSLPFTGDDSDAILLFNNSSLYLTQNAKNYLIAQGYDDANPSYNNIKAYGIRADNTAKFYINGSATPETNLSQIYPALFTISRIDGGVGGNRIEAIIGFVSW